MSLPLAPVRSRSALGGGVAIALGATALAVAGLGMTTHMIAHMAAVAVAPPLLAFALRGGPYDLALMRQPFATPLAALLLELALVWGWHLPAFRAAADHSLALALVEQAMFLGAGWLLWSAALAHRAGGVAALLLTSMHMTLLGVLIALAPRVLYAGMAMHHAGPLDPLADQQLGGVAMLAIGGASYMAGGLALLASLISGREARA